MQKKDKISMSVIRRLPRYYRFLNEMVENGIDRISSRELSDKMGLTASQIRQDLNCFGEFGQQGYGYAVSALRDEMAIILGLDKAYKTVLIGAGNLGRAVANHTNFTQRGFNLIGIFDSNPAIIGSIIQGVKVSNVDTLKEFCKENKPEVAVLCLPFSAVEPISNTLIEMGVKNFWNFSHYDISMKHEGIIMENVHMSDSLMTLCYRISHE